MTRSHALMLRQMIEKAAASLDDKDISECPEFCGKMRYDGSLISYQTPINWNGEVKRARQDIWDLEVNNPDNAPNLWADIKYRKGIRIIPEIITAEDAFSAGEKGWWGNDLYESLVNGNVYTPEQYAPNWKLLEKGE